MPNIIIYIVTFNAPNQLEEWCNSFILNYPSIFKYCKKFVINNSNDSTLSNPYKSLYSSYDLHLIHSDSNLGICGGRYFAAEHFHSSKYDYMIYFEDDMLMRPMNGEPCKFGFTTYHDKIFENSIEIMNQEGLHFLKLCFTEVFGSNHQNWSLISLSEEDKHEISKIDIDGVFLGEHCSVDHLATFKGLAYVIGIYHYCNWPILFNREGNKLLFIDNQFPSKHELKWMRLSFILAIQGILKIGCLLASPIIHSRKYSYNVEDRIENELGLKIEGVTICTDSN